MTRIFLDTINNSIDNSMVNEVLRSLDFIKVGKPSSHSLITTPQLKDIFSKYVELHNKFTDITPFGFTQEVKEHYKMKRDSYGRYYSELYLDFTDSKDIKNYLQCFTDEKLNQLYYAWQTTNNGLE